LAQNVTLQPKT